ncbi:MAG: hypothetical protein K0S76_2193 [Herbinix sp.]|jgi:hypothetical protein|nr:hypothetical protein [Herbinix sp.]
MKKKRLLFYTSLKKDLKESYSYTDYEAKEAINSIRRMDRELKEVFVDWYHHGVIPSIMVEGLSYEEVLKNITPNPVGAFLYLDFLKKNPTEAKKSLVRGMDQIIISKEDLEKIKQKNNYVAPETAQEDTSDISIDE